MRFPHHLPPAIVVGGGSNALSIVHSLAPRGIRVFALNEPRARIRGSRLCSWLGVDADVEDEAAAWARVLLDSSPGELEGAVVLAASDSALEMIVRHRASLADRFRLDLSDSNAQLAMLDKLQTYEIAHSANVETPRFWRASTRREVEDIRDELIFPLLVKPRLSHHFQRRFAQKFFTVDSFQALLIAVESAFAARLDVLLTELIPGPDSLLSSYYTYLNESGRPLFDFTKRVIRRYPTGMGLGCLHVVDQVDGIRDAALRLFQAAGLRGLANAEFKLDPRTGVPKLIECNARFTAANRLVFDAGIDLPFFVYARTVGLPLPPTGALKTGLTLWDPIADLYAFRELRRRHEIGWGEWLASIGRRHTLPNFYWNDPIPSWIVLSAELKRVARSGRSRAARWAKRPEGPGAAPDRSIAPISDPGLLSKACPPSIQNGGLP